MNMSTLLKLIYPPPPSLFITAMSVIGGVSLANAGYMEFKGKNMQYSKFWNLGIGQNKLKKSSPEHATRGEPAKLPGRNGMLVAYTPAFLAGVTSFAVFPHDQDLRFTLLTSALTFHFFKRILEVLFIHKYSGSMPRVSAIAISSSYFLSTTTMIYAQYLTQGIQEPTVDLKYVGAVIFVVGIIGNFYHHYLLSKLRGSTSINEYKIPQGGLFNLVTCPHYLFEILVFIGVSCISQTFYASSFTVGTTIYLMGRSYATRKWYLSTFEDFPKDIKSLIPFIF